MNYKNIISIFILLTFLSCMSVFAGTTDTYEGISLNIHPTAYTAALGGADFVFSNSINSLYSNPAGLANLNNNSFIFSHLSYFQDINLEYAGICLPIANSVSNIGLDFTLLNSGDIDKTIIKSNGSPEIIGEYDNSDMILGIYYAAAFPYEFNLGFGLKYIDSKLDDVHAQAFRGNISFQKYVPTNYNNRFVFAGEIKNFGSTLKYDLVENKSPLIYKLGLGYIIDNNSTVIRLGSLGEYVNGDKINFAAGINFELAELFNLNVGYNSKNDVDNNFTYGAGFILNSKNINKVCTLDYAYVPYGDLGNSHRFTITLKFGPQKKQKQYYNANPVQNKIYKQQLLDQIINLILSNRYNDAANLIYMDMNSYQLLSREDIQYFNHIINNNTRRPDTYNQ